MDKELLLTEVQTNLSRNSINTSSDSNKNNEPNNLFSKYNIFINCYNKSCNRVNEKTLSFIPQSKLFTYLEYIIKKPHFLILLILSLLIPFIGIFFLLFISISVYQYFKGLKVHRKNQKRIKDPFMNMKFDPLKCSQLKKNYHFITINFKNVKSEFNFKQNQQLAESQRKSGQTSQWMIYNQIFASYYADIIQWKTKLVVLLLTTIILSFGSSILLILLI